MNGYSKAVLVVSDLHCGSIFGMLPLGFTASDDKVVNPNAGQAYLWSCWVDLAQRVAQHPIVAVVVNGDVIDGSQGAQRGTELALPMLVDQALAAEACLSTLKDALKGKPAWYFIQGCVTPGNRVLRDDMTWTPAEKLVPGDGIMAFDKFTDGTIGSQRRWQRAIVTAAVRHVKDVAEVKFSDGTTITATLDHPWLCCQDNHGRRRYTWIRTQQLAAGQKIRRLLQPWAVDRSYDAGWLAGFFDGEGTIQGCGLIELGQNPGPALDRATSLLSSLGFRFSLYENERDKLRTVHLLGGTGESLRFLGMVRPGRLLNDARELRCGIPRGNCQPTLEVLSVTPRGPDEIVGLSTSAHTYIAEGFGHANTEYHDSRAGREVEAVARAMGGRAYVGAGTGRYSREALDLDVDGVVLNFAHHISASGGLYRATAPDREGVWSALGGKEGKVPRADVVVRSHVHCFTHVEHPSKHVIVTPCWQLQTRFMRRKSYYRMVPDIGAVLLWIDGAAKKKGEDPVVVQKYLYPLPPLKPVKL